MKTRQSGFGVIEQLVVTIMGALFILLFVHGTLIVLDRYFSVQTITSFDEDRKILRAQVATWASIAFSSEVYMSNEILSEYNISRPDGNAVLPYAGSFGSGLTFPGHAIKDGAFVVPEENPDNYDITFLMIREATGESLTIGDDESPVTGFNGNPGLYRFNQDNPYVYVDRKPELIAVGDVVALSSVAGAGFAIVEKIEDRKITLNFDTFGTFRPDDPLKKEGPFVVFYKGGTISKIEIVFIAVELIPNEPSRVVLGKMNRKGADAPFTLSHELKLPTQSLRLVRGSSSSIPGGTFIPFETPQQLAAAMKVPSFLSSRLQNQASQDYFSSEMTFLVPL